MRPMATVVMPLLRQRDEWLRKAVESAVGQTAPTEVVVVRSRETPASNLRVLEELTGAHANLRVLFQEEPRGFPQALNYGMRAARTERIGILLSDDWLAPDCVAMCVAEDADIVSTRRATYFADGVTPMPGAERMLTRAGFDARPTLEAKASYLVHFLLFRRSALERAGWVDETVGDYPGVDDYHLLWTMLEQGATVAIVEKFLYQYRDHPGERLTLGDEEKALGNLRKILDKHGVKEPEYSKIVARHLRWYGKPLYEVLGVRPETAI